MPETTITNTPNLVTDEAGFVHVIKYDHGSLSFEKFGPRDKYVLTAYVNKDGAVLKGNIPVATYSEILALAEMGGNLTVERILEIIPKVKPGFRRDSEA